MMVSLHDFHNFPERLVSLGIQLSYYTSMELPVHLGRIHLLRAETVHGGSFHVRLRQERLGQWVVKTLLAILLVTRHRFRSCMPG